MNVILVYKEDYPWDVRVEKLASALLELGNTVTLVCRNIDQKPTKEQDALLNIYRLPRFSSLPLIFRKLFNLPIWFNPFWLWLIYSASRNQGANLIIVRDLPLVKSALILRRILGVKVVLDMAEVYPEMYASLAHFSESSLVHRLLKHPKLAQSYEKSVIRKLDHTLVMIEESKSRLIDMGVSAEKITIVSNTPPIEKFGGSKHTHVGTNLNIVYVGFITELRGLDLLIEAVAHYINRGHSPESIKVDIVGKGKCKPQLEKLVIKLGITQSVNIHGWLRQAEVNELMAGANVGALTYRVCGHWNHTIPNKIFDYMLAGLPVLSTEVLPIQRIVAQEECGLICRDLDSRDIAEKLEMLRDPKLRALLGDNGYDAVKRHWNWSNEKLQLAKAIGSVIPNETKGSL